MNWDRFFNPAVIGIIMGCGIPIVAIICSYWHSVAKTRSDHELKRSMIERGMSADEIERVLAASSGGTATSRETARRMAEHGSY